MVASVPAPLLAPRVIVSALVPAFQAMLEAFEPLPENVAPPPLMYAFEPRSIVPKLNVHTVPAEIVTLSFVPPVPSVTVITTWPLVLIVLPFQPLQKVVRSMAFE